jgi:hypothetical protein
MTKINPPPNTQPVIDEETGLPTLPWILYFGSLFTGDTGTTFTPVPVSMGVSGSPTYTGAYYRSGQFFDFWILITPNGGNTTSTAGTTYFTLPFDVIVDGSCFAVLGLLGSNSGMVEASTNRCYTPTWTAATVPLTISGRVRAQ